MRKPSKPWYQSKTLWLNVAAAAIAVLQDSEVVQVIPPEHMNTFLQVVVVANAALRIATDKPLTLRKR